MEGSFTRQMQAKKIESEAKLTFMEATSIIIGHGVGSGILAVPYLASRNSIRDIILIIAVCYCINLFMHFMIAELSYNNGGAQFIKCFENELFTGKLKTAATWIAFGFLGLSVLVNVAGFIAGAGAVFKAWFGMPAWAGMLLYYVIASIVVFYGMKLVGICENISVYAMIGVLAILFVATMFAPHYQLPNEFISATNVLALYSMVSFSLSAVMSVPQVVKGLGGDTKKIRLSIITGTAINVGLIVFITLMTLIGTGSHITEDGALVDLSRQLGGWVAVIGYIFSLLALSTSFWANTLNLRDIVNEQIHIGTKKSYLLCSILSLILAMLGLQSFVGFTRFAGIVQVLTGLAIILTYHNSRKLAKASPICGWVGKLPWQIIVMISSVLATVGSVVAVR